MNGGPGFVRKDADSQWHIVSAWYETEDSYGTECSRTVKGEWTWKPVGSTCFQCRRWLNRLVLNYNNGQRMRTDSLERL